MAEIDIPKFDTKEELFDFLIKNKDLLIKQKKSMTKHADSIVTVGPSSVGKAAQIDANATTLQVKSVINTTNILDSHSDVHIKGIWNKALKENKNLYLLQEHQMSFDKVISDDVKASAQMMTFKELGFPQLKGEAQALVFNSTISKDVNPFMFKLYANGRVKEHSVGMQYVKIALAINSEEDGRAEAKAVWDKYIDQVANKQDAENQGFFWAVTEAKFHEGSAVLMGSNSVTPTISVESKNIEPSEDTQKPKPSSDTSNKLSINNFI